MTFYDRKDKRVIQPTGSDISGRGAAATARRHEDTFIVRTAFESGDKNPFEPGSRRHRMFERYLRNGIDSDGKPDQHKN